MSASVTIVQLYPDELGVAGDRGNAMSIIARLRRAGVDVSLVEHHAGDSLPAEADLVLVGNGPLSAMRNVYDDLVANTDRLRGYLASGVPFFAYGSGAELLSRQITLLDGSVLEGLGIFAFSATRTTKRKVGYVLADTAVGQIAGFEDNASDWILDDGAVPFGTLVFGGGNGDGKAEGVRFASSIATQVGGPILPLNPALTDSLIKAIADRRGLGAIASAPHDDLDRYAAKAREVIIENAKHVFSRI
jgi:CobQ-like glutamine amidotransferase family enzyme